MYAKIRDTKLYFDIEGSGLVERDGEMVEKPAIIFLAGGPGGDHMVFRNHAAALKDMAQLIYLDFRGCGRSDKSDPESWTMDNNIEDIEALRQHLGIDKLYVLGSSYGGMVAQGYGIRYSQNTQGLVLVATAPSQHFREKAKENLAEIGNAEQRRVCERLWAGNFETEEQMYEYFLTMGPMYSNGFDEEEFKSGWKKGGCAHEVLSRGFRNCLATFDHREQLSDISCPTLVLGARNDWVCDPSYSEYMAEKIPDARLKIYEDSKHVIILDKNAELLEAVRRFIHETSP